MSQGNFLDVIDLPVVAMVTFFLTFVGVVWRVYARRDREPLHAHLASLPLLDDEDGRIPLNAPTPPTGGRHV